MSFMVFLWRKAFTMQSQGPWLSEGNDAILFLSKTKLCSFNEHEMNLDMVTQMSNFQHVRCKWIIKPSHATIKIKK